MDDYLTAYRRNVVVTDAPASVDLDVSALAAILLPPFPNPARHRVQFRLELPRPAPVRVEVVDTQGRRLQGWSAGAVQGQRVID